MFEIIEKFQTKPGDVKITPSNRLLPLSFRAVPFYYAVDDELLKSWNFEKTERFEADANLSYHTDKLSSKPSVQEPLAYSMDKYDFFRIEGHQGKDYRTALQQIDGLKRKYGLAFDVKALSVNINTQNLNIDDYECEFEDLQVMLRAWTADQECVLAEISKFLSGLSLKEPGTNVTETNYDLTHFAGTNAANRHFSDISSAEAMLNVKAGAEYKATAWYQPHSYYKKSTVVSDNLTTDENALGIAMKTAFDETKGGSVNDTIAKAKTLVENQMDSAAWSENPEMKALLLDNSVELMAYANKLTEIMPDRIGIIDVSRVNDYKLTLSELCKLVKKLRTRYESVQLAADMKSFTQLLITQLSSVCCSGKKLEILQEEINNRKERILLRLQLAKFVEKHPGTEHMAGVPNGGTFILVYLNKVQKTENETAAPARAIAENRNILNEMGRNMNVLPESERRSVQPVISEERLTHGISEIGNISEEDLQKRLKLLEKYIRETDLPGNTVVADFALPYMCCSDCAPVNFIVPKPPVFLRLETDTFCLGKDESPLIFEVSPDDGVIKADPEVAGVSIEGKKLSIDENAFPENMLGKPVGFTVNDQVTDVKLTVHRGVEFDFSVPESPTTETEITFTPTGNLEGASFLWSFGDDNMSAERNPTHRYQLPVNEENKVTVSLTVTAANGVCSSTVEHEIRFEEIQEEVRVELEEKDYCENDEQHYEFRVFPEGADATIEGPGVQRNDDGIFVFVPANAGTGEHTFKINGNPSGITVTVHEAPVAKFTPQQVNNRLVITNNSTGAGSFIWNINDETIERDDTSQIVKDLTPNSPTGWWIKLTAVSENCGEDSAETEFTTEFVEDEPTCVEDTKTAIHKDLQVLIELNMPSSNFVAPIWKSTSEIYGGTADFNNGVLDDADKFLNGQNNEKLPEMFPELLQQTAQTIVRINEQNPEEAEVLMRLFTLQLRLFYNILRCQDQEIIDASADNIKQVLDVILELLLFLKSREIILPDNLIEFLREVWDKLKEIPLLNEHFSKMKEEGLI
ncbi:MAG: PKD domain-containing protein [Tangfeifania sp.]